MSRAYRIRVSESVRQHIRVDDGFQTRLELLAVLPAEEMAELCAAELERIGFGRDGQVMRRTDEDGVEIEVDLAGGTVTARAASETDVDLTVERNGRVQEERLEEGRRRLRESVVRELEGAVEGERRRLTAEVSARLERKLRDLRRDLDRVESAATAAALEIRARQLGEVQEVSENPETGEITIRVKV